MDNVEASINVGQTVPFVTGQFTGAGGDGGGNINPFQTIDREDIGIKLTITPKINEGDAVQLLISQEVSSLSTTSAAVDLITNKREINTRVIVDDGDIIVLGGLIDDTVEHAQERVPVLGSIPVLGALFRYQRSNFVKRNLMVFLRPQILRNSESATLHTNQRYRRMQELQRMLDADGVPLMPGVDRPKLPPLEGEPEPAPQP